MRQQKHSHLAFDRVSKSIDRVTVPPPQRPLQILDLKRVGGYADACYVVLVTGRRGALSTTIRGSIGRHDRSRWFAAQAQTYAWNHGFSHSPIRVPRPIGYDRVTGWWWYHNADGVPVVDVTERTRHQTASLVGRALRKLHQLDPVQDLHRTPREERSNWNNARRVCQRLTTPVRNRVYSMIDVTEQLDLRFQSMADRRIVHHDLHPQNILVGKGGIVILDFTEARLSHPLVDVATSVIQWGLQGRALRWRSIAAQQRLIWKTYKSFAPRDVSLTDFRFIQNHVWQRIGLQRLVGAILEHRPTAPIINDLSRSCPNPL